MEYEAAIYLLLQIINMVTTFVKIAVAAGEVHSVSHLHLGGQPQPVDLSGEGQRISHLRSRPRVCRQDAA